MKGMRLERGWISRLQKYHDLHICTRPTCSGILVNGIRRKKYFQPEISAIPVETANVKDNVKKVFKMCNKYCQGWPSRLE